MEKIIKGMSKVKDKKRSRKAKDKKLQRKAKDKKLQRKAKDKKRSRKVRNKKLSRKAINKKLKWLIHDGFFKSVFSDLKLVGELLKLVFPSHVLRKYDLDKITPGKDTFGNDRADLVILVPSRTDPRLDWLIIIEHKSYYTKKLYQQMFKYQFAAREYYSDLRKHPIQISSLVFYHGRRRVNWKKSLLADDFKEYYKQIELKHGMINYVPFIIDIHDAKIQQAFTDPNCEIRGLIKLMAQAWDIKGCSIEEIRVMIKEYFSYIMESWKRSRAHRVIRLIMSYIKALGDYTEEEMQELKEFLVADGLLPEGFDMTLEDFYKQKWVEKGLKKGLKKGRKEGMEKGRKEGMEKGMEKGREEGQRDLIFNMLKHDSISVISKMTGYSEQEIQKLLSYR